MLSKRQTTLIKHVISYIVLTLFAIFCFFPLVWMIVSAFKPLEEVRAAVPTLFIQDISMRNFEKIIEVGFFGFIKNSLIVSTGATLISLAVAILGGYSLSRFYNVKFVKVTNFGMMLSQMIPGVLLLVPLYVIMQNFGLLGDNMVHIALIAAYTTFVVPICTFMMSSFYDTVPLELEEAAEIDGCGKLETIVKIILPISLPSIVSTGLYAFINAWNEFMFGYIFVNSNDARTLTPAIMLFKGANVTDWGALMAGCVFAVVPVAIIFILLQRFFISDLMFGAVKG